jgi:hypothetical protein
MIERRKRDSKEYESVRPSFWFSGCDQDGDWSRDQVIAQLTEDIRNNLEELNKKQMLQCDVRDDVRRMRVALEKIARKLTKRRRRRIE